jgi:hypothetical protein
VTIGDEQWLTVIGRLRAWIREDMDPLMGESEDADTAVALSAAILLAVARGRNYESDPDPVMVVDDWLSQIRDQVVPRPRPKVPVCERWMQRFCDDINSSGGVPW